MNTSDKYKSAQKDISDCDNAKDYLCFLVNSVPCQYYWNATHAPMCNVVLCANATMNCDSMYTGHDLKVDTGYFLGFGITLLLVPIPLVMVSTRLRDKYDRISLLDHSQSVYNTV